MVCVRRSLWERVTLREEFVGRLSLGSRLPQYLKGKEVIIAIHGGGGSVSSRTEGQVRELLVKHVLDDCDVYWRSCACSIYRTVLSHFAES